MKVLYLEKLAEREGFEPPEDKALNGFQDRRFQPLSHLSGIKDYNIPVKL
jgi:hypothetical protein